MENLKKQQTILALDIAGSCGYAVYKNGEITDYGVWDLKKHARGESVKPHITFYEHLAEMLEKHEITHIVAEDVYFPVNDGTGRYIDPNAAFALSKLHGVLECFLECNDGVTHSTMSAWAAKRFMFSARKGMTRPILKKAMMLAVEELGYKLPPQHADDVADAIGILCCYLNEKVKAQ